jgi:hypothetical protein
MRIWLLLLLVALVGCAGHRPQGINVRLTPHPTLGDRRPRCRKRTPRRTAWPI